MDNLLLGISGHPLNSQEYGANYTTQPLGITRQQQADLLAQIGAKIYRMDVATNAGGKALNHDKFLDIIAKCAAIGCKVLPMMYDKIDYNLTDQENYDRGYAQGSGFATEYGSVVEYVELGNEIELFDDMKNGTGPGTQASHYYPGMVESAVAWIHGAYDGVRAVSSTMKILTPGSAGFLPTYFYDQIFAAVPGIDLLSWHVYHNDPGALESNFGITNILDYLWDRYGKPIWITETNRRWNKTQTKEWNNQQQIVWHEEFYNQCISHPHTESYIIHELLNMPTKSTDDEWEENYGIYDFIGIDMGAASPPGPDYQGTLTAKPYATYLIEANAPEEEPVYEDVPPLEGVQGEGSSNMTMQTLDIYRNAAVIASVEIDEQTVLSSEFMGMDKITATFITPQPLALLIGDYIDYNGVYKLKHATACEPTNTGKFKHTAIFYGRMYDLYDASLVHQGRTKFVYTGTPLELLSLVVDALNDWFGGGWSVGDVEPIAEPETIPFDQVSCRVALNSIADKFKLEYSLQDKAIYMRKKIGTLRPITLRYGRGLGLQMLRRESVDQPFATVWRFYGGNKNIPAGYRGGMDRITVDGPYELNTAIYGRKGGSVTFEDVYPQRTSTVETAPDIHSITDSTIDFDLNEQFITDGSAKILFKTGPLGGQELVITSYDHTTKTIYFGANKEADTGYTVPNDTRHAEVGDQYTIIGITMPQTYLDAAEAEVMQRGIEHAKAHSHPPVAFPLLIDEKYIRETGLIGVFKPGDSFPVVSESLGVNSPLRLQSISFPLVNPAAITGVISDVLQYTVQERIVKDVKQNIRVTNAVQQTAIYARQVADEISNAAILQQFKRTYVGERAVLSGAFVAGNPETGEVAGINGTGTALTEVRFWAGAAYADRNTAPFRVQQDGKAFMTAAEVKDGCKVGSFEIQGGYLRTSDYSEGGPNGVLISDQGISSRNAGASLIPATSGIIMEASFFGNTNVDPSVPQPQSIGEVSAGVIGIKWQELTNQNLQNTGYSRGSYGGLFSSFKNIGAEYMALRWSEQAAGTEVMTNSDRVLIVQNDRDIVTLPDTPDHGRVVTIKNARAVTITLNSAVGNDIVDQANALSTSLSLVSGEKVDLIFYGQGKRWFVIDRLRN